jgi:hypothetical protein
MAIVGLLAKHRLTQNPPPPADRVLSVSLIATITSGLPVTRPEPLVISFRHAVFLGRDHLLSARALTNAELRWLRCAYFR